MSILSHFCFYLVVLFGCYAMLFQFSRIRFGRYLQWLVNGLFIAAVVIMAYGLWFGNGADLSRYYMMLDDLRPLRLHEAFMYGYYKTTILANIWMWLIAQTGNKQLLPCLTTLFIMCNLFYLISLEQKRVWTPHATKLHYLIILFAVVTLAGITTGIRHAWMMSVFAIAVYRDLILHKKGILTFLLYGSTCFLHSSGIMLILIRLFSLMKGKMKCLIVFWIILAPYLQQFIDMENVLGTAASKFFVYQDMYMKGLDIRWQLARLGFVVAITGITYMLRRTTTNKGYYNFYVSLLLFTWGSVTIPHLFLRLTDVLAFVSLPIINDFYKTTSKQNAFMVKVILTLICLCLFAYHGVFLRTYMSFI